MEDRNLLCTAHALADPEELLGPLSEAVPSSEPPSPTTSGPGQAALVTSWGRGSLSKYALARNGWDLASGPSATWPNYVPPGQGFSGGQFTPVFGDTHYLSHSDDWVYVRALGVPTYVMGPWSNGQGGVFPNFPTALDRLVRITRFPQPAPGPYTRTTGGAIGLWVNGTSLFNMLDLFSWSNAQQRAECALAAADLPA